MDVNKFSPPEELDLLKSVYKHVKNAAHNVSITISPFSCIPLFEATYKKSGAAQDSSILFIYHLSKGFLHTYDRVIYKLSTGKD